MLSLDAEELAAEYRMLFATGWEQHDTTQDELALFKLLQPQADGSYLNWGAGRNSRVCNITRRDGYRLSGYEPYAPGERKWCIRELCPDSLFDGIMSNNVLEHLSDPITELRAMLSHLKPRGVMVHRTPCYEYLYMCSRFHLFFFLGTSVEVMARRVGLVARRTADPWVVFYERAI